MARLVVAESPDLLERLSRALASGRLSLTPTIAALQDVLGVDNRRAAAVRESLAASEGRSVEGVLDCLSVARLSCDRARAASPSIEVAWTHPGPVMPAVRSTGAVAREIIDGAQRSLLVVGYSVTVDASLAGLAAQTVSAMASAAARGAVVTAILHRDPRNREALLRGWPPAHDPPGIFTWPEREGDEMASLHAKVLVADARDALVTSANLTYHGLEANVEVGVRIVGAAAGQLEVVFHELIRVRDFVPWPR